MGARRGREIFGAVLCGTVMKIFRIATKQTLKLIKIGLILDESREGSRLQI